MYFFDRKTMYFIWKREEGQAKGVGSVRFLAMEEVCRIEINITGCGRVTGTYPVFLLSGGMESFIGDIVLTKGKGSLPLKSSRRALGDRGFPYQQVTGIRIDLKTEGVLEQKWLPLNDMLPVNPRENDTEKNIGLLDGQAGNADTMPPYGDGMRRPEPEQEESGYAASQTDQGGQRQRSMEEPLREGRSDAGRRHVEEPLREGRSDARRRHMEEPLWGGRDRQDMAEFPRASQTNQGSQRQQSMEEPLREGRSDAGRRHMEEPLWGGRDRQDMAEFPRASQTDQGSQMRRSMEEPLRDVRNDAVQETGDDRQQSARQTGDEDRQGNRDASGDIRQTIQLYPDKWQQLCAIYPIVHPFGDGRAYLSMEPRDFVVLQEKYQPMVQNSFLLHGFYHYRHLLLGRQHYGRSMRYYLGVPGVFYEKEKAAALFYGFESFESAVDPAPEGSFGYYLKQVQI